MLFLSNSPTERHGDFENRSHLGPQNCRIRGQHKSRPARRGTAHPKRLKVLENSRDQILQRFADFDCRLGMVWVCVEIWDSNQQLACFEQSSASCHFRHPIQVICAMVTHIGFYTRIRVWCGMVISSLKAGFRVANIAECHTNFMVGGPSSTKAIVWQWQICGYPFGNFLHS